MASPRLLLPTYGLSVMIPDSPPMPASCSLKVQASHAPSRAHSCPRGHCGGGGRGRGGHRVAGECEARYELPPAVVCIRERFVLSAVSGVDRALFRDDSLCTSCTPFFLPPDVLCSCFICMCGNLFAFVAPVVALHCSARGSTTYLLLPHAPTAGELARGWGINPDTIPGIKKPEFSAPVKVERGKLKEMKRNGPMTS